jgi:hypothetical protein
MIPEFDEHGNLPSGIEGRAAQKGRYGGELYPGEWPANADGTTYLDFFQRDRLKQQKGIIAIDLTGLP